MNEQPEKRRGKLRLVLILGLTAVATAVVGFGGLAAWNVSTANNGNTFAAGTVAHTNIANGGASCASGASTAPTVCDVIWNKTGAQPGDSTGGIVSITSTGDIKSTFVLAPTSISGSLCADIDLTITDGQAVPTTIYSGPLSGWSGSSPLTPDTGSPTGTWVTGDTGTFTFALSLPLTAPQTGMGQSCTTSLRFTQTAA